MIARDTLVALPSGTEISIEAALGDLERASKSLVFFGCEGDAADMGHVAELVEFLAAPTEGYAVVEFNEWGGPPDVVGETFATPEEAEAAWIHERVEVEGFDRAELPNIMVVRL